MNRKELRNKKKEISVLGEVVKIVRQYFPEHKIKVFVPNGVDISIVTEF